MTPPNFSGVGDGRADEISVIYNPAAGTGSQAAAQDVMAAASARAGIRFMSTQRPGHAVELAREAARSGSGIVAAMGGDGTINEVARGLLGTGTALGIVPTGSGNGLARHIGVPLNPALALNALATAERRRIDVGRINGRLFLCTAGLGFDAHVSRHFATAKRRGLLGYVETCVRRYTGYRPTAVEARFGGRALRQDCYLMAFANASQYGNDARIAPHADLSDGVLDLCLIDRLPLRRAMATARAMMAGTLPESGTVDYHTMATVTVQADAPIEYHADGEYLGLDRYFEIELDHLALEIAA